MDINAIVDIVIRKQKRDTVAAYLGLLDTLPKIFLLINREKEYDFNVANLSLAHFHAHIVIASLGNRSIQLLYNKTLAEIKRIKAPNTPLTIHGDIMRLNHVFNKAIANMKIPTCNIEKEVFIAKEWQHLYERYLFAMSLPNLCDDLCRYIGGFLV
jgi:hypothetical protein